MARGPVSDDVARRAAVDVRAGDAVGSTAGTAVPAGPTAVGRQSKAAVGLDSPGTRQC